MVVSSKHITCGENLLGQVVVVVVVVVVVGVVVVNCQTSDNMIESDSRVTSVINEIYIDQCVIVVVVVYVVVVVVKTEISRLNSDNITQYYTILTNIRQC